MSAEVGSGPIFGDRQPGTPLGATVPDTRTGFAGATVKPPADEKGKEPGGVRFADSPVPDRPRTAALAQSSSLPYLPGRKGGRVYRAVTKMIDRDAATGDFVLSREGEGRPVPQQKGEPGAPEARPAARATSRHCGLWLSKTTSGSPTTRDATRSSSDLLPGYTDSGTPNRTKIMLRWRAKPLWWLSARRGRRGHD